MNADVRLRTSYLLRVAAVNEIGVGPFTQLNNAITIRLQYGKSHNNM